MKEKKFKCSTYKKLGENSQSRLKEAPKNAIWQIFCEKNNNAKSWYFEELCETGDLTTNSIK